MSKCREGGFEVADHDLHSRRGLVKFVSNDGEYFRLVQSLTLCLLIIQIVEKDTDQVLGCHIIGEPNFDTFNHHC